MKVKSAVISSMTVLVSACFSGCSQFKCVDQEDPFRLLYSEKLSEPFQLRQTAVDNRKITLSAHQMSLGSFCRLLSDHFNVGIVYSDKLSSKSVAAEFKDTDINTVFTVLSRQLGVDLVKVGNTFYLGELKDEDKGILIRRVLSQDEENLKNIVDTLVSSQGKGKVLSGRVVIVSDKDFVIRRMSEALDDLERVSLHSWIVQLYFLVLRKDALAEGGLTMSTSGTLSYNISENSLELKDFRIEGLLSGLLESSYADLFASPMLICRDGVTGTWSDGQKVPVPKRTITDYGTITTTGFDYIDTGLQVKSTVKESKTGGYLELEISLSDIKSYVEGNPVTSQTRVNCALDMEPNKIYLLSELQRYSLLDREEKTFLLSRNKGKSVIQVWGRIYRINNLQKEFHPTLLNDREFAPVQQTAAPLATAVSATEGK